LGLGAQVPDEAAEALAACVNEHLGTRTSWAKTPTGYPDSLALCVIDSIWSMGVNYGGVENVLSRYIAYRREQGADPYFDGHDELLAVFEELGLEGFTGTIGNHQRTSTRSGIPKTQAVRDAIHALGMSGVKTASMLREPPKLDDVERAWCAVRGQRSGISWHYLRILSGSQDIKADRMIRRFLKRCLGYLPGPQEATSVLNAVAPLLDCDLRTLDHAIWVAERSLPPAR
jgi:hypothetical protein